MPTGTPFLLGRMTHNNNPINVADQYFTGKLDVRLAGATLEFPWTLNETPNNSSPQSNPNNDDFTNFTSQIDDTEITIDGLKYKLVVLGFTQDTGLSCPASPSGSYVNEFRTTEGTQTYGCLYAELAQVRKLTIEKIAISGEAPFPNFGFSSTSNLAGSPWSDWSDNLKPTATGAIGADSSAQQDFLPSEENIVVTEAAVNGWTLDSVVCKDGSGQNVSGINVNVGDREVTLDDVPDADSNAAAPITCTFRNKPKTGTLTLVKTVVNDSGGTATTADFQAKIDGDNVDWDQVVMLAVGDYTASEVALAGGVGYTAGSWGGDCAANGTVTIGNDQDKTCTIVNDDDAPSLQLKKTVINDNGGTSLASAWTLSAGANDITGSATPVEVTDQAGTYDLSESTVAGYTNTSITCDNAQGEVTDVTVGLGETVICEFINDDDAAGLTLIKQVVNDNGGTALASAWTLSAGSNDVIGSESGAIATTAAGTYDLSESIVAGYTNTSITCDNAQGEVTDVTVGLGESVTCTFVNDDDAANLIVKKVVINDDGGTLEAKDFTFVVNGGTPVSFEADGQNDLSVDAGTYTVTEPAVAGYATTYDDCSSLEIPIGGTATCTITNDDISGTITLNKTVSGGNAALTDFVPSINGTQVTWGVAVELPAGSYTASEAMSVSDYVAGEWGGDCAAQGSVDLALGENLTCTITNYFAELTIKKSADPTFFANEGDIIGYTVTATNSGMATLTGVELSDALIDALDSWTCDPETPATLAPGESITCTAEYKITAADVDEGSVPNTACASSDETSQDVCDDETVYLSELEIEKSASVAYFTATGDQVVYTVKATNTGEFTLTNVDISDDLIDGLSDWECTPTLVVAELAAGESITCTATYEITDADVEAGSVLNTACAVSEQTPEVCDDVDIPLAEIEIVKSADPLTYSAVGDEVEYTITATNTGSATLDNVDISDELIDGLDGWTCKLGDAVTSLPVAELASGQSITCTATYTVTDADVTGTDPEGFVINTACVDSDQTDEVCDSVTTHEIVMELVKSVTPDVLAEPGGVFTYTLFIDNESAVPVEIQVLTDDNSAESTDWAANCAVLVGTTLGPDAPGDADSVTCSYTVERTEAGTYPNTAMVTVEDEYGTRAWAQDDESVRVLRSELEIVKSANVQSYSAVGDEIDYTIIATNTGEATLTNVDISDALIDGLESWECTPEIPATLAPGEQITCTATYEVTQADITAGTVFNQACVESDETPEICDDVNVDLISIVLDKSASRNFVPETGTDVTFTLSFSHPAEEPPVYMYSLVDDVYGDLLDPANPAVSENDCTDYVGLLVVPDQWYTCQFTAPVTVTLQQDHVNTATIIVTDGEANNPEPRFASANDDAVVKLREPEGSGEAVTPKPTKPPTDMLLVTDTLGGDAGSGFGDPIGWAVWVLLSALLILSTGFVIRRERLAEVRNRR